MSASLARTVWRAFFGRLLREFDTELSRAVGSDCESLLDVGCGFNSPVQRLAPRPQKLVGVDGFAEVIEQSRAKGIHDDYRNMSILEIGTAFAPGSFDVVLACDVIEHLTKEDGFKLLEQMEKIARKRTIIFTPNGFLPQGEEFGNPYQRHISGWTADEMTARGYQVVGINGLRPLRGEMAQVRWRPHRLWLIVSLLTQLFTRDRPAWAFQILCVKEKDPA